MTIEYLFEDIKRISLLQNKIKGKDIAADAMKFNEEAGELNKLVCMRIGRKKKIFNDKQLKKEFILEGADVLQNLFLLCQNEGIEFLELVDGLEEKNKKWRKQLLKELNKKNAKVKTNTR